MTYEQFDSLVRESQKPVILVEGTRNLCKSDVKTENQKNGRRPEADA